MTVDPFGMPIRSTTSATATAQASGQAGTSGSSPAPVSPSVDTAPARRKAASTDAPGNSEQVPDGAAEADKKTRSKGAAVGGKAVEIPAMPLAPSWPTSTSEEQDYTPEETFDASDLADVNRQLNRCRSRLFKVTREMNKAQREAADADLTYRRALRRALVQVTGSSAEMRKAIAELMCEEHETDLVVKTQVAEEWKKLSMTVRDDLKAVENLSHNVRAQMDVR